MARQSGAAPEPTAKAPKVKKRRWYHQLWQVFQMTRRQDPAITPILLGTIAVVLLLAVVISLLTGSWLWFVALLPFAVLAPMVVLARRAETAAYTQIEGQPGAAMAALGTIRRGWSFTQEPVAVDPRSQDLVFRGVGRAGIVLVSEGPAGRAARLLEAERKRTARVVNGVPIHLVQMGDGEGQVPLRKLPRTVQKMRPTLTKQEVGEVTKRLTALGAARPPIPKGVDPYRTRPDRKGARGR
ncbi:DUF4191 domain-containing protein [Cellulomonas marina]|uniref:DUF4191 domain-containing protein n=1 Tax=Cellulomonas marina TaxID=988821 RepID=A0A1I0VYY0_9CELL|nr:DUF4191 domain-containing protein [Cellulomonas marina]GIG27456.1 hypothetical protein Cma02nite_00560 [Cellulomonas marina]SFA81561.1 protein of unknown function [Cellulomonas marina]